MEIYNRKYVEILKNGGRGLKQALSLFYHAREHADELGVLAASRRDLALELDVTPRTILNYAHALSDAGLIKYKFSGKLVINPELCFAGTKDIYEQALDQWKRFCSDI